MLCQIIILIVNVEEFSIPNLDSIDNYNIAAPCLYYGFLDTTIMEILMMRKVPGTT